ncbi:hypothetical protein QR680_004498 [Steinernema hermaphroditum]|uniref:Protein kinase domain-containing protein n=1 Tax=Steinernema hermaphroditum TaxID=289476 RepID=A0AA39LTA2_9BILA|nr:hypothetical protein QR680_004498 [Steinernema hermaphroditum]
MSATAQMAAMLNELMGVGRNAEIGKSEILRFYDESVCKHFLAAFCPHELFVNTKADLGQCKLVHDEELRRAYRESNRFERLGYERRFLTFLSRLQDDMKRKIARHEERLALTQTAITPDDPAYSKLQEQIATLDHDIENLQKEASEAGAAGEIRKAQEFIERSDRLQQERAKLKANLFSGEPGRGKTMEVCQICGCFMNVGETQQRLDEHLNGRQHVGYAKVNATIEELKERLEKIKEKEDEQRQQEEGKNRGTIATAMMTAIVTASVIVRVRVLAADAAVTVDVVTMARSTAELTTAVKYDRYCFVPNNNDTGKKILKKVDKKKRCSSPLDEKNDRKKEDFLNEAPSVEAEMPLEKGGRMVTVEGFILEHRGRKFRYEESADGDFGVVKATEDTEEAKRTFMVVFENHEAKCKRLKHQASVMARMASEGKARHFLRVDTFGMTANYQFLIYEEHVAKLALDTLEAIEDLHSVGYIHRDIKPTVFAMGARAETSSTVLLMHLGLTKKFRDSFARRYRPRRSVVFFGTVRYAARTAFREEERSRRDDLESWFYMIVELFGEQNLPWRRLGNKAEVLREKSAFMTDEGISRLTKKNPKVPNEFVKIVTHINQLKYEDKPNYDFIREILRKSSLEP